MLDPAPDALGPLVSSRDISGDSAALQARLNADGYLFLPGYLDADEVAAARSAILDRLAQAGLLDPTREPADAIYNPALADKRYFMPELADGNVPLHNLLYGERMLDLYRRLFDGPVRHYDYTWMRAVSPGGGTAPHCDVVYMGRGTHRLLTAWTPLGDIDLALGGLMVLENSHRNERLRAGYGQHDVDTYCTNHGGLRSSGSSLYGALSANPVRLRARLGGRWLTTTFQQGDLLTFTVNTVHASLDNQTDQIRLSSDTRYQPAHEPADLRWVRGPHGEPPPGHGEKARRDVIC